MYVTGLEKKNISSEDDTFKWISGDFQDKVLVSSILKECDTVFHLVNSSTPASGNLDKASDLKSNVLSTTFSRSMQKTQG